jgi:hypothetical protein
VCGWWSRYGNPHRKPANIAAGDHHHRGRGIFSTRVRFKKRKTRLEPPQRRILAPIFYLQVEELNAFEQEGLI